MNYQEAILWLANRPKLAFDKGVERVKWLLEELGDPQLDLPTIHVVGTNGKGSTVAFLEGIFMAAGYRVGRFTSPSIINDREQVVVDGHMISEEDFARLVSDLQPVAERLAEDTDLGHASDFELWVVLAFVYFARVAGVDLVLVEAGMGGLMDATNVLSPLAVVCPSIGLDHQAFLGDTLVDIARQKAGVLSEGVPFFYASQDEDVVAFFDRHCHSLSCPVYALGREIICQGERRDFAIQTPFGQLENLSMKMYGQHQLANAALAVAVVQSLSEVFPNVKQTSMVKGVAQAIWPGRLEFIRDNLVLDGAHNREGIAALCRFLEEEKKGRKVEILFAAINTKPASDMLAALAQQGRVTVTTFEDPRAIPLAVYAASYPRVSSFRDWVISDNQAILYVITGSLYFIKQVRAGLLESEKSICGNGC